MKFGFFVVAYDVSESRERRKIDRLLTGLGQRVQKSVFECCLDKARETRLILELKKLRLKTGHVRLYRLSGESVQHTIGVAPAVLELEKSASFIV